MKIKSLITSIVIATLVAPAFIGCSDNVIEQMKDADEAKLLYEFSLVDTLGRVYKSNFDGSSTDIVVKVKTNDVEKLKVATPKCFLSYGATISPDPAIPQDFTVEGGVKYVVTSASGKNKTTYTVTWEESQVLPYGEGFSKIEPLFVKSFPELGYPGEIYHDGTTENRIGYGDLMAYVAFCGPNHIVLYSRAYGWGYDNQEGTTYDANEDMAIRVFNKETGEEDSYLNLGENQGNFVIDVKKILAITSDDKGHMVAVTGLAPNLQELFYWTDPNSEPVSLGKTPICLDCRLDLGNGEKKFLDMYANPQIRGDVTSTAMFTMGGARSNVRGERGRHYIMKIVNGKISSEYREIFTNIRSGNFTGGYNQGDNAPYWQMISPFTASDETDFVVGYTEGIRFESESVANQETARVSTYSYDFPSSPINQMANNVLNTRPIIEGGAVTWWSKLGMYPLNTGGRVPVVNGMVINGKKYVLLVTQYDWNSALVVTDETMSAESVVGLDVDIFVDPIGVTRATNFGSWGDWYYDESTDECYVTAWFERASLHSYKISCQKLK